MKLLRPRVVSVAAAGLGVALGAVGLTHAVAASAPAATPRAAGCTLRLDCVPVVGEIVGAVVPSGLVDRGTEQSVLPSVGGGTKRVSTKKYASDDQPWQGPGQLKVGRRITVQVMHSERAQDEVLAGLPEGMEKLREGLPESVKAQAGTLPSNVVTVNLGVHKAYVTEQRYPLKKIRDKKIEQVPVSSVGIALSPTDHVLITGEGIPLVQLQAFAATVEVL